MDAISFLQIGVKGNGVAMDPLHKDLTQLSQLVESIYEAGLDPSLWDRTLSVMADWVGTSIAMLFTPTVLPQDGGFYFNHGISEASMELWQTHYQPLDIWTTGAIEQNRVQEGLIFTGREVLSTEELTRSPWYQEFLSPVGIGQVLVNIIYGLNSTIHHPTVLSYFRGLNDDPFDDEEKWKSSLLLPHVSRALGVAARLCNTEYELATSLIALDRLRQGTLLIGKNEEILFSNKAALRILNLDDGLKLQPTPRKEVKSYLITKQRGVQESLDEAIREMVRPNLLSAQHFSKTIVIPRPSGRVPFVINFSPLPSQRGFVIDTDNRPRAIAFISDSSEPIHVNHALLREAVGLTKAEIRTSEFILDGRSLEDISKECGLSVNTLKTHLNRIYSKTNTGTRASLVKLLVTLSPDGETG
jgi:DNA-binding CsgD family transcriptional regulator